MLSLIDHKTPVDLASLGVVASSFAGALPHIAAGLSVIWTLIRIYETPTFQKWLEKRRTKKEVKDDA